MAETYEYGTLYIAYFSTVGPAPTPTVWVLYTAEGLRESGAYPPGSEGRLKAMQRLGDLGWLVTYSNVSDDMPWFAAVTDQVLESAGLEAKHARHAYVYTARRRWLVDD